jgi:hypothetical protein
MTKTMSRKICIIIAKNIVFYAAIRGFIAIPAEQIHYNLLMSRYIFGEQRLAQS